MPSSTARFSDNPRLALTELRDFLATEERKAQEAYTEWKDDPLMQDIAGGYSRRAGALAHVIAGVNVDIANLF